MKARPALIRAPLDRTARGHHLLADGSPRDAPPAVRYNTNSTTANADRWNVPGSATGTPVDEGRTGTR
jgi:hypothetical protein